MVFRQMFGVLASMTVFCLAVETGFGMTLSEEDREKTEATIGLFDNQSAFRIVRQAPRPSEPSVVQAYINSHFTFPSKSQSDPQARPTQRSFRKKIQKSPSCARGKKFCVISDDQIPQDFENVTSIIQQLLKSHPSFTEQFNTSDVLTREDTALGHRDPDNPRGEELCGHEVTLKRLSWGWTEDESFVQIAQSKDFVQKVRLETCTYEDCPCSRLITSGLSDRYVTRCRQKYIYRELLALKVDDERKPELKPERVMLPSCCACVVYKRGRKDSFYEDQCKMARLEDEDEDTESRISPDGTKPCLRSSSSAPVGQSSQGLLLLSAALLRIYVMIRH